MYIEMMSNVVSIFGEFQNPNAKEHEKIINAEVKESLEHFSDLMENLIQNITDLKITNVIFDLGRSSQKEWFYI